MPMSEPVEVRTAADALLDREPEYLINAMEAAGQHENPHSVGYGEKRGAVFGYIARLQRDLLISREASACLGRQYKARMDQVDALRADNAWLRQALSVAEQRHVDHCPLGEKCIGAIEIHEARNR